MSALHDTGAAIVNGATGTVQLVSLGAVSFDPIACDTPAFCTVLDFILPTGRGKGLADDLAMGAKGKGGKVGGQRDGTPGSNQAQNRQFRDATQGLTPDEQQRLHHEISGENLSFHEIKALADEILRNRGR